MFDIIFVHAKEIMFLLIGVSIFMISISFTQALLEALKILKRINRVTSLLEKYIQKPIKVLKQVDEFLGRFF